jgi:hypothetical protein
MKMRAVKISEAFRNKERKKERKKDSLFSQQQQDTSIEKNNYHTMQQFTIINDT